MVKTKVILAALSLALSSLMAVASSTGGSGRSTMVSGQTLTLQQFVVRVIQ